METPKYDRGIALLRTTDLSSITISSIIHHLHPARSFKRNPGWNVLDLFMNRGPDGLRLAISWKSSMKSHPNANLIPSFHLSSHSPLIHPSHPIHPLHPQVFLKAQDAVFGEGLMPGAIRGRIAVARQLRPAPGRKYSMVFGGGNLPLIKFQ